MSVPWPFLALITMAGFGLVMWRPYLTVVLFGLFAPLGLTQLPASLDVVTVLSLLVVGAAVWNQLTRGESLIPQSLPALAAVVWSLGILGSVAFSSDLGRAAVLGTWQILAAWLAVSIAALVDTQRRLRAVLVAVLVGSIIVAATGLSGGFNQSGVFNGSIVDNRAMGVFSQPNEYGLYSAMMWAFSLGVACLCRGRLRVIAALCSILSLAGLAASFSRGSWLGAAIAALAMAALVPQTRRPQAVAITAAVTVIGASLVLIPYWQLPGLLMSRFLSIFSGESNPYDNRPALFSEGLRQWAEQPVFGIGPNMYPVESQTISSATRTLEGQHAHNLIVTMGAEQGIIGLIALGLFVVAIVRAVRAARQVAVPTVGPRPRAISLGAAVTLAATGGLISLAAAGLVDYPLRNALTRSTAWLLVGLVLAGHRVARGQGAASSAQRVAGEQVSTL
ncbi:MAG: O-antigen ligase family protein [Candidatus Nanopelagicales bacterium]